MNTREQYDQWLKAQTNAKSVLALGIVLADKSFLTLPLSEHYPIQALEQALRPLADAFDVASLHRLAPQYLRWIYSDAQVYCARRPDKHLLAVFLPREVPAADAAAIEDIFKTFTVMSPS